MTWDSLHAHHTATSGRRIIDLFEDKCRAEEHSVRACDMLFDYSKTGIDAKARELLLTLADQAGLADRREAMFSGEKINETEGEVS